MHNSALMGALIATLGNSIFSQAIEAQVVHPAGIPVDLTVSFVPPLATAEGERHLMYELRISNFGSASLTLARADVLNDATGQQLVSYDADTLPRVMIRPGTPGLQNPRVINGGLTAVIFVDVEFSKAASLPPRLVHRLTFEPVKPPNAPIQSVVQGAVVPVPTVLPVSLGPPVRGSGWVASHALSNFSLHRRTLLAIDGRARIAQRFAIDFTRVGADGQVFRGNPAKNSNWSPYGADVLAVEDGRVVEIQDGIPENDPTAEKKAVDITLTTVGGNYLILDLGGGRFAFYAHLQPGSFKVRKGDQVKRGQVIAKLGNSGQSDAPHLHLHIVNAPSPLVAEGLPVTFSSFTLLGHVPSLRVLADGTGWRPSQPPSRRRDEMPVENAVVEF